MGAFLAITQLQQAISVVNDSRINGCGFHRHCFSIILLIFVLDCGGAIVNEEQ
jgi:hypothetical protein